MIAMLRIAAHLAVALIWRWCLAEALPHPGKGAEHA